MSIIGVEAARRLGDRQKCDTKCEITLVGSVRAHNRPRCFQVSVWPEVVWPLGAIAILRLGGRVEAIVEKKRVKRNQMDRFVKTPEIDYAISLTTEHQVSFALRTSTLPELPVSP